MSDIRIECSGSDWLPLKDIVPFQGELKSLSKDNYKRLKNTILKLGFSSPFFVWKHEGKNYCLDGHQRLSTLKQMTSERIQSPEKFPCIVVEAKDKKEAYQKLLALASTYGKAESQGLYELMSVAGLELSDLEDVSFPEIDLENFALEFFKDEEKEAVEDEVPGAPEEPKVRMGDLFTLGSHRLLCGDSTNKADVERLMSGEKADMVFTDPPYGMNLDTDYSSMGEASHSFKKVEGDDKPFDPTHIFEFFGYVEEIFLWGADYYAERIPKRVNGSWVVWDKRSTDRLDITAPVSLDKMWGSCFELCWSKGKHKRDIARIAWVAGFGEGKLEERTGRNNAPLRFHPTQKPLGLAIWFFDRWGKTSKLVWDGYLGSGSTLMACEKTKRKCYGMEIDPHYCHVILDRWAKYTGLDPVREDGTKWSEVKK